MTNKTPTVFKIELKNVKLSFPDLYKRASYMGEETKYGATILVDKFDKVQVHLIESKVKNLLSEGVVNYCLKTVSDHSYVSIRSTNNEQPVLVGDFNHFADVTITIELKMVAYVGWVICSKLLEVRFKTGLSESL